MSAKLYLPGLSATVLLTAASVAAAQEQAPPAAAGTAAAGDSACMQQLRGLSERMQQDGYWLSGWNDRYGVSDAVPPTGGMAPTAGVPATTTTAADDAGTGAPGRDASGQPVATGGDVVRSPWGDVGWTQRPQFEIRTLYNAAVVLARRGNDQACQAVASAAENAYGDYTARLQEIGIAPEDVTSWRQEQLLAARPVTEIEGAITSEDVIGADIRNGRDEDLGEIDPRDGSIRYVVVSHGGFLGIGEDRVVVPWNLLRVSPGFNTFVLPVTEQAMEAAPRVEDGGVTGSITQSEQYWTENIDADIGAEPAAPPQ